MPLKRGICMTTPRVAAIHDMSGFGRCSLTVAIPILSAMGIQCCPLPTAFLSTHTGGVPGLYLSGYDGRDAQGRRPLEVPGSAVPGHLQRFLGSERQIGIVEEFIRTFRTSDTLVVVDPVMGDYGKVYQDLYPRHVRRHRPAWRSWRT